MDLGKEVVPCHCDQGKGQHILLGSRNGHVLVHFDVRLLDFMCMSLQASGPENPFLPHDAMQAQPMPSCAVCLSVHPSVCHVRKFSQN